MEHTGIDERCDHLDSVGSGRVGVDLSDGIFGVLRRFKVSALVI